MSQLATRYKEVQDRISAAATLSGRQASDVELIVITKTHPTLVVAELADLGHRSFGENKDQEARPKAMELDVLRPGINFDWHFVGQLQSNKVKSAMSYAKTIHSLDRPSLLKEIAKQPVSYTHFRAHETVLELVCRLLLEKKKKKQRDSLSSLMPSSTLTNTVNI